MQSKRSVSISTKVSSTDKALFYKLCEEKNVDASAALRDFIHACLTARSLHPDNGSAETAPRQGAAKPLRAQFEKELKSAIDELYVETVNACRVAEVVRRLSYRLDVSSGAVEEMLIERWQDGKLRLEEGSATAENDTLRYRGRSYAFVKL